MSADLADRLRRRGYRLTPQRLMVLQVLAATGEHLSAEAIHEAIAASHPSVNLSTVYRTLDMLEGQRIVRRAEPGDQRRLYEMASSSALHHHLVCRTCARIAHVPAAVDGLPESLLTDHGFQVEETVLTSFGTCRECGGGPAA